MRVMKSSQTGISNVETKKKKGTKLTALQVFNVKCKKQIVPATKNFFIVSFKCHVKNTQPKTSLKMQLVLSKNHQPPPGRKTARIKTKSQRAGRREKEKKKYLHLVDHDPAREMHSCHLLCFFHAQTRKQENPTSACRERTRLPEPPPFNESIEYV